jgi:hypothetical protein
MAGNNGNKGKPSGKYAEDKTDPGRKGDFKRAPWPEEGLTQRDDGAGNPLPGEGAGRIGRPERRNSRGAVPSSR